MTYRRVLPYLVCLAMVCVIACVDPHATDETPPTDQRGLLHRIRFDYQSVIMAVGDTVRLHVRAHDLNDDTTSVPSSEVTWQSNNTAVRVDSLGQIIALSRITNVARVIGSWTHNDVRRADTANVRVVAAAAEVASVKVTPLDSGRKGFSQTQPASMSLYDIRAWNSQGQPISSITLEGRFAGNPRLPIASAITPMSGGRNGVLAIYYIGDLWIKTRALIFGKAYQDSAKFTGLYPADLTIELETESGTNAIVHEQNLTYLQPCGVIKFVNNTTSSITIAFDQETAGIPCGGSVPASGSLLLAPGQSRTRVLSVTGDIRWRGQLTETNTDIPRLTGTLSVRNVP